MKWESDEIKNSMSPFVCDHFKKYWRKFLKVKFLIYPISKLVKFCCFRGEVYLNNI